MVASDRASQTTVSGFLAAVRAAGVLTDAQFRRAAASLSRDAVSAPDAATELVAAGVLTRFQADRLLAGKTGGLVLGQYVILEPVGVSRSGRVFKARHRTMNRFVAVKVLSAEQSRDPARRAWFYDASRAAARVVHPNVVTLLDANQVGDRLYVVREFVDGPSLDAVVREAGPLPVARACEVVRQAALGLHHAHEQGLPHGAMCPAQLLVGRDQPDDTGGRPSVKVSNVGLRLEPVPGAVHLDGRDPADFRAPELKDPSLAATPEGDAYALGGAFYFLLTGKLPAGGEPLEALRPDVPAAVAVLVRALRAADPAARPMAAAVAAALEPFGETGDQVEFNLPLHPVGGSQVRGYLSGIQAPGPAATPVPVPADDTSPWASLGTAQTADGTAGSPPIVAPRSRRTRAAEGSVRSRIVGAFFGVSAGLTVLIAGAFVLRMALVK